MPVRSLGQEDPLEQEMATHSSMLAWRISWTEKPGRLQSVGLQRVKHFFFLASQSRPGSALNPSSASCEACDLVSYITIPKPLVPHL